MSLFSAPPDKDKKVYCDDYKYYQPAESRISLCIYCFLDLLYELVFMQQQQFGNAVLLLQHQGKVLDGPDGQFILQS